MITRLREQYTVSELCHALDVPKSSYYESLKRRESPRQKANQTLLQTMKTIHSHRHKKTYGSPRMTQELRSLGHTCSVNRVARIMRKNKLRAVSRKAFIPKTTRPDHSATPSPNLLKDTPPPNAPGEQIVSDITYIPTREGWMYLAIVLDLFNRAIIGWKIDDNMRAELVTRSIHKALSKNLIAPHALFHSDRGSQYTAKSTRRLLQTETLRQSMSAAGYCYDNAYAESAFATIKNELLDRKKPFQTKAEAATAVFDYIETFYNSRRLHSSLGYLSPDQYTRRYYENLACLNKPKQTNSSTQSTLPLAV